MISYKDYPSIIKNGGFNGYSKGSLSTSTTTESTSSSTTESSSDITYTVVKGDTLSEIASKYGTTWQKIYNDNKDKIGSNPNLIQPGTTLVIK